MPIYAKAAVCLLMLLLSLVTAHSGVAGNDRTRISSFRCGNDLIHVGDTAFDVLNQCRKPDYQRSSFEEVYIKDPETTILEERDGRYVTRPKLVRKLVEVEEWIYNFGPHRFIHYLTFEDGELIKIEFGDYGYR